MSEKEIQRVLDTLHAKDWSHRYEYHNTRLKKNIWFRIGSIEEFAFLHHTIDSDLKRINPDWEVTNWITLLIYTKGGYFRPHTDDIFYDEGNKRIILSGGYLLNQSFSGGGFVINGIRLESTIGELFYFGRDVEHEVEEVVDGIRYSLHFGIRSQIQTKPMI